MSEKEFYHIVDHEIGKLYFLSCRNHLNLSNPDETKECVLMYMGKSVDGWCCHEPNYGCRLISDSVYQSRQKKFIDLKTNDVYYLFFSESTQTFHLCVVESGFTHEVYFFYAPIKAFDIQLVNPQEKK